MNDELKAKYNRIANDPSQLEMFKNDQIDAMSTLQAAVDGKTTIEAVTELIEGGTLDGKFNSISTEGFLTAEAGVSTPSLTCDGTQINAQKPVVELMNGYTFTKNSDTSSITRNYSYASVVKNGNKITFVVFLAINFLQEISPNTQINIGFFGIPSAIGAKLFPYSVGSLNDIIYSSKELLITNITSGIEAFSFVRKNSNTDLQVIAYNPSTIAANTSCLFRFEATFLLSENLAA